MQGSLCTIASRCGRHGNPRRHCEHIKRPRFPLTRRILIQSTEMAMLRMHKPSMLPHRRAVLAFHGLCSSPLEVRQFRALAARQGFRRRPDAFRVQRRREDATHLHDTAALRFPAVDRRLRWRSRPSVGHDRRSRICGVSLGATLALAVAAERPDADATRFRSFRRRCSSTAGTSPAGASCCRWPTTRRWDGFTGIAKSPPYGVKNQRVRAWIAEQLASGPLSSAGASTIPTPSLREADRLIRHVKRALAAGRDADAAHDPRPRGRRGEPANVRFVRAAHRHDDRSANSSSTTATT